MKDYPINDTYGEPFLPTWDRSNDPSLDSGTYNTIEYTLNNGHIVIHLVHPKNGIAWTIRHARGIANDSFVQSWRVIRGMDKVVIAQAVQYGELNIHKAEEQIKKAVLAIPPEGEWWADGCDVFFHAGILMYNNGIPIDKIEHTLTALYHAVAHEYGS